GGFAGNLNDSAAGEEISEANLRSCARLTALVRALSAGSGMRQARLWIVTPGAQDVVADQVEGIGQAALGGLRGVIMSEHPDLRCTLIDLDPEDESRSVEALLCELAADDIEQEIALRGAERFVPRIVRGIGAPVRAPRRRSSAGANAFRLQISRP